MTWWKSYMEGVRDATQETSRRRQSKAGQPVTASTSVPVNADLPAVQSEAAQSKCGDYYSGKPQQFNAPILIDYASSRRNGF